MNLSTTELLSISIKPLVKPMRRWWIKQRLIQSQRNVEVIRAQRLENLAEERAEHMKQVHLVCRLSEIERA